MKPYKNILVPTDLSEHCNIAAKRAEKIANSNDAEVTFLHIINYLPPTYISVELPAEYSSKDFLLGKAKSRMTEWTNENGMGQCKQIIDTGQPKKAILKQIKKRDIDLVVLAPHDENGLAKFFGSVTNAVAQGANVDILITRP